MLGHAMLLTLRGVPTIYYGDEQGFVGTGGDQQSRQDMFPSKVASYNERSCSAAARRRRGRTSTPTIRFTVGSRPRAHPNQPPSADARPAAYPLLRPTSRACLPSRVSTRRTGAKCCSCSTPRRSPIRQNVRVETRSKKFRGSLGTCPASADAPGTRQRRSCLRSASRSAMLAEAGASSLPPRRPPTRGGRARRSIRSIRAVSPIRTVTASAICRASPPSSIMSRALASTRSGCPPSSPHRCATSVTTSPIIAASTRSSERLPTSTASSSARTR